MSYVPLLPSGIVEHSKREGTWKSPHARKASHRILHFLGRVIFHAHLHFAYSTIPEGKWGTTLSCSLLFNSNFILNSTVKPRLMATTLLRPFFLPPDKNHHTFSCKRTLVNKATPLIQPNFFGAIGDFINRVPLCFDFMLDLLSLMSFILSVHVKVVSLGSQIHLYPRCCVLYCVRDLLLFLHLQKAL